MSVTELAPVIDIRSLIPAPREAVLESLPFSTDSGRSEPCPVNFIHGFAEVEGAKEPVSYTAAVPAVLDSHDVAVHVPGFGAFKRTSREFRNALAGNERIISVSYDPSRLDELNLRPWRWMADPQKLHVDTIQSITDDLPNNKSRLSVPNGDALDNANFALIAHSMGGLPAPEWAVQHPQKAAMVIYLGAIGLEKSSLWKIVSATPEMAIYDILPAFLNGQFGRSPVVVQRCLKYMFSSPLRTLAEIGSCARADSSKLVEQLRDLGIPQSVICFEYDRFFSPDATLQSVGDIVDDHEVMAGCEHTAPQTQAARVASVVGRHMRQLAS